MMEDLSERPLADRAVAGPQTVDVRHDLVETREGQNASSNHKASSMFMGQRERLRAL
jgi:hypothetical protein